MEIFNRQDGDDDFWVTGFPDEPNLLGFHISEDSIYNCFDFLLERKDVQELRDSLSKWLGETNE